MLIAMIRRRLKRRQNRRMLDQLNRQARQSKVMDRITWRRQLTELVGEYMQARASEDWMSASLALDAISEHWRAGVDNQLID